MLMDSQQQQCQQVAAQALPSQPQRLLLQRPVQQPRGSWQFAAQRSQSWQQHLLTWHLQVCVKLSA